MCLFTSDRDRRLWLWALIVLVAIFATLGPVGTLVEALRGRTLLRLSGALVLLLVAGVIVGLWARRRPSLSEIGVTAGAMAVYLLAWIRMQHPEERTHLIENGLVAVLIHQALIERLRHKRRELKTAVLAVVVTALLGWLDEGIQAILPNRYYDIRDVGFNALAGLMAVTVSLVLARVRRWRTQGSV